MQRLTTIILLFVISVNGFANATFDRANAAYKAANYTQAIALYDSIARAEGVSPQLYYNLGNAYYKTKEYPASILNYERALKLNPAMDDAKFNLQLAQTQMVDKIEPIGKFFVTAWIEQLALSMQSNTWAIFAIVTFILALLLAFVYFFSRYTRLRKIAFFSGIVMLFFSLSFNYFSGLQKEILINHDQAIVMAAATNAKSSPDESGTELFVLHGGTKVTITNKLGKWSEIVLPDGNKGWIPTVSLAVI